MRVGILLSGRGSNMMALVEQARGYTVALVASDRPEAPGLAWAAERGLPTFASSPKVGGKAAFEAALDDALCRADVHVIALAGYMRLLSDAFVARWRGRIVNIHPSLLPSYRGLDTHARAIAAGDAEAGCSVHLVTEELDAGTVLGQARVPVMPDDSAETLAARVLIEEHRLYPRILAEFVATMIDPLPRLRAAACALPEVEERTWQGQTAFFVADEPFAQFRTEGAPAIRVRVADPDEAALLVERDSARYSRAADLGEDWIAIALAGDPDWTMVEDRIARSWEMAAPRRLLEAGGR